MTRFALSTAASTTPSPRRLPTLVFLLVMTLGSWTPRVGLAQPDLSPDRIEDKREMLEELCGDRLLDIHMKDLSDLTDRDSQCVVGEGGVPVARLFTTLQRMGYQGFVNLEYEIDPFDPVPGMHRSFAFMRGVLAGLDPS